MKKITIPIQLRVDKNQIENIKQKARELSVRNKTDVKWQDLVRGAINKEYPSRNR